MISLGDTRVIEKHNPQLLEKLQQITDPNDKEFKTAEFNKAMKDTRNKVWDTLENFISDYKLKKLGLKNYNLLYFSRDFNIRDDFFLGKNEYHPYSNGALTYSGLRVKLIDLIERFDLSKEDILFWLFPKSAKDVIQLDRIVRIVNSSFEAITNRDDLTEVKKEDFYFYLIAKKNIRNPCILDI